MKKPKLEDYYDVHDPRGCSTSEIKMYHKAVEEYENYLKETKSIELDIKQTKLKA